MKYKTFALSGFKALDQAEGIFEALVAVFNNVDEVGDKIIPGAFKKSLRDWKNKGRPIPVLFSHDWKNLDAHIGQVLEGKETEEGLYVKGQLEMDEPFAARVWKKMQQGTLAEFSFSYDELDSALVKQNGGYVNELRELALIEVGPCLKGTNRETQLLRVKAAFAAHGTATSEASWDGPANRRRTRSGEDQAYYRRIFAWKDPEGDPGMKSTYKFVHHEVDGDGNPGAANVRACQTGIGVLNGGRGGTTIPDGDRRGVWNHLARHLRDADVEPPELKSTDALEPNEGAHKGTLSPEQIQQMHDLSCKLGAKCGSAGDGEGGTKDEAGDGKSSKEPSTYAERVAIEMLELDSDT